MKKLIVFFDLDGVLVPTASEVEKVITERHNIGYRITEYDPRKMSHYPDKINQDAFNLFFDTSFVTSIQATSEAQNVFRSVSLFCETGIVTQRPSDGDTRRLTILQCQRDFNREPWIVEDKARLLKAFKVDYYVEDCFQNAVNIADNVCPCYLLDTKYNQGEHRNIIRVPTLSVFLYSILKKVASNI